MKDTTGARMPSAPIATWVSPCGRARLYLGDCREFLHWLEAAGVRIDAIETDPPWGKNVDIFEIAKGRIERACEASTSKQILT